MSRMITLDPTLVVLLFSSLSALAAALGVLPQAVRGRLSSASIGWSNALAAGLMLGVAYALLTLGPGTGVLAVGIGALAGLAFVRLTHAATGTGELDVKRLEERGPEYGYQLILGDALHAAHEGVAIGVAMLVSLPLGVATALALAVHNVPEAMVLVSALTSRGVRLSHAAGIAVAANANQVLLAIVTFAVAGAAPELLPWVAGFAVGALVYLVLVDLLPESYRQAGHTSIALVAVAALAMVVLLTGAVS